uniref:Uncharacterized protein n=1 Tax=Arundo donax TaxID=35708 RepID=A0A0A9G8X1_ARUDO
MWGYLRASAHRHRLQNCEYCAAVDGSAQVGCHKIRTV